MNEDLEGLSISINQILIAILSEYGKLTVPTLKLLETGSEDKELVIDYDENVPSFTFSLRDKNEQ